MVNGKKRTNPAIPSVYAELLAESGIDQNDPKRPLKRKRRQGVDESRSPESTPEPITVTNSEPDKVVPAVAKSDIEDDPDDDFDEDEVFEDVNLAYEPSMTGFNVTLEQSDRDDSDANDDLVVELNTTADASTKSRKGSSKKNVLSKEEVVHRQVVHKIHLLSLIYHVSLRNKWANDSALHGSLRSLVSQTIKDKLFPPESNSLLPVVRSRRFLDGLIALKELWQRKFSVTAPGLCLKSWDQLFDREEVFEPAINKARFVSQVEAFRGSRDLGAQGFCALLRSIGLDVRLVCSFQPLDFTSTVPARSRDDDQSNLPIRLNWRDELPSLPIYWVEVYNAPDAKWVAVDPIVTGVVEMNRNKSQLEPSTSDPRNLMRYVLAFNTRGFARDVTRRYTQFFNTKTMRKRIDSVDYEWWNRVMKLFSSPVVTSSDVSEIKSLVDKEAKEPMPFNVQDFKKHPKYILERHLAADEILLKKESCGTFASRGSKSEPIYLRKHLAKIKSARVWYKEGRVIKSGAAPRKMKKKHFKGTSKFEDEDDNETAPLYSIDQTDLYIPPPVGDDNIVPKSKFRSIDIFVPSMLPSGACQLTQQHIEIAAKLAHVDFARAVTGFKFQRGVGAPIYNGIVIAERCKDAVLAVYDHVVEEQREEDRRLVTMEALARWRKYILSQQIKIRLEKEHGEVESESGDDDDVEEYVPEDDRQLNEVQSPVESSKEKITLLVNSFVSEDSAYRNALRKSRKEYEAAAAARGERISSQKDNAPELLQEPGNLSGAEEFNETVSREAPKVLPPPDDSDEMFPDSVSESELWDVEE